MEGEGSGWVGEDRGPVKRPVVHGIMKAVYHVFTVKRLTLPVEILTSVKPAALGTWWIHLQKRTKPVVLTEMKH